MSARMRYADVMTEYSALDRSAIALRAFVTCRIISAGREAVRQTAGPEAGISLWKPKHTSNRAQRRRRTAATVAQSGVHLETPSESYPGVQESPDLLSRAPCTPTPLDINVVKTLPTAVSHSCPPPHMILLHGAHILSAQQLAVAYRMYKALLTLSFQTN